MNRRKYFYDPKLEKNENVYAINIYKISFGKPKLLIRVCDWDYKKLLTYAHNIVYALNHMTVSKRLKRIFSIKKIEQLFCYI